MSTQSPMYPRLSDALPQPPRGSAGFTLIEMLVALSLTALIMVLLTGGLYLGKRTWEVVDGKSERVGETRLALEFIRRQLSAARGLTHKLPGGQTLLFWGDQQMLEWVAPLPAYVGYGGLSIMRLSTVEVSDRRQLVFERWFYHPQVLDGDADNAPAWIPMEATSVWSAEEPDATVYGRHVLVESLEEFEIAYFGASKGDRHPGWHDRWSGAPAFPKLLRIRLRQINEEWPDMIVELPQPSFEFRG